MDGEGLNIGLVREGDDGGVKTLGEDDHTGAGGVLLGEVGNGLGDLGDVGGLVASQYMQ